MYVLESHYEYRLSLFLYKSEVKLRTSVNNNDNLQV